MRLSPLVVAACLSATLALEASGQCPSHSVIHSKTDASIEGGWVVQIPSGSSDYFNVRYDLSSVVTEGLNISVADFGASTTYPRVGLYGPNPVDPSGNTPDLSAPFQEALSPPVLGGALFQHACALWPEANAGPLSHAVVQFPPGDSGLLGVGADTDSQVLGGGESPGNPNPFDSSGFTTDGYSTPSIFPFGGGDFGIGLVQDPKVNAGGNLNGLLRLGSGASDRPGDYLTLTTKSLTNLGLSFFGPEISGGPTVFRLFLSSLGVPIAPVGPVLSTAPSGEGTASFHISSSWPLGAENLTLNFIAISGVSGVAGSIGVSNEVTVYSLPDPVTRPWGTDDDGTYETGWVVSIPGGSGDYFNVNHGDALASGVSGITGQRIAVMDFGTSVTAFPSSGKTPENLGVDPTGNTPDLGNPYILQPFPFPALTFCTTSGQMVARTFATFLPTTPHTHSVVQHPPNEMGLLAIGGDTNATFTGLSGWTSDGYTTPAQPAGWNWGMRCDGF